MSETLLLPPQKAAKLVGIGKDRAYQFVKTGVWPSEKIGKRKLVPVSFLREKYADAFIPQSPTQEADHE